MARPPTPADLVSRIIPYMNTLSSFLGQARLFWNDTIRKDASHHQ